MLPKIRLRKSRGHTASRRTLERRYLSIFGAPLEADAIVRLLNNFDEEFLRAVRHDRKVKSVLLILEYGKPVISNHFPQM